MVEELKSKPAQKKEVIQKGEDKKVNFKNLYEKLSAPIEEQYIIEYEEDGKKLRGYNGIAAINRLNEVIGIENWATTTKILKEELVSGNWIVAMEIKLTIKTETDIIIREGNGGAYARKIENAYKAARTSAFKNACKYLGIGKELYLGNKDDDDIVYVKEETNEVVLVEADDNTAEIETFIKEATNIEQLQALKEKLDQVPAKFKTPIYKLFNDRKIEIMTK